MLVVIASAGDVGLDLLGGAFLARTSAGLGAPVFTFDGWSSGVDANVRLDLKVDTTARRAIIRWLDSAASARVELSQERQASSVSGTSQNDFVITNLVPDKSIHVATTSTAGSAVLRMTVTGSGFVGIATSTPSNILQVLGSTMLSGALIVQSGIIASATLSVAGGMTLASTLTFTAISIVSAASAGTSAVPASAQGFFVITISGTDRLVAFY